MSLFNRIVLCLQYLTVLSILSSCHASTLPNSKQDASTIDRTQPYVTLDSELSIDGVSMRTELDTYGPDTKRILVYWENNTDMEFMFGEYWELLKYKGDKLEKIVSKDEYNIFLSVGYGLQQGETRKHVYLITRYTDKLDEGQYQIKTHFSNFGDKVQYDLTTDFTVSNDESKVNISELDYENIDICKDITPFDVEQRTSMRIYKDKETYNTTLVIDSKSYNIAPGLGGWGVIQICLFEPSDNKYLVYAYSRGIDTHFSRIGVFDLSKKEEIFSSRDFEGYDLSIGEGDETSLQISSAEHQEDETGGESGSLIEPIGYLIYENGHFSMVEN